ncbi:hypothetical protein PMAA_062250 [Talaromyces marneffei ATCC 18224]|uniref:Uncharacterized protein n=1 Tax=Talaromyces marneffei (strain ATCC 18224 / CBS 334.59 / QM 7333) TaxID=441960 RepID=B6Q9J1_TALMQ|nr:hypothetical protein PMAA_062250 [Talaromyces marneffei ATCC 18224]
MILMIVIDKRVMYNLPFLIVRLGKHDVILGRMWLARYKVLVDCNRGRLLWPEEEDADRRDKNFQSQAVKDASVYSIQKRQDDPLIHPRLQEGIPILHGKTYRRRHTLDLDRMRKGFNEAINKAVIPKKPESFTKKAKRVRFQDQYPETDIALIGAAGFARHIRDKESETFVTSLSELEKAIEDKRQLDDADSEAQEIKEQLPERYHEFADVFSKIKSDELPERKEYDHRIELE